MNRSLFIRTLLAVAVIACSTGAQAEVAKNPPPAHKLQGYSGYELKPVTMNPELAEKKNIDKVVAKVQENLSKNVGAVVTGWNSSADASAKEKLVIEPYIESLHKPSGANRFFAGAAAGNGRILMKVKITEQPSGKVVAEPEFYRQANAMAGAWTLGAHDNAMLEKVTQLLANYLSANYSEAVGGDTGFEP
jgi:ABC-type Na+ efflux pump permease subunit